MAVPLLSQDEFCRHLELQSVHVVKFAYRQALKERLRATTRNQEGGVGSSPSKIKSRASSTVSSSSSPSKWLSPKSSKRIFNSASASSSKSQRRESSASLSSDSEAVAVSEGVNVNSTRAILETMVNNCNLYMHPKIKKEISAYGESKLEKRVFVEKSTILERRSYLSPKKNGKHAASASTSHSSASPLSGQGAKQYTCKVLLQSPRKSGANDSSATPPPTQAPALRSSLSRRAKKQHRTKILLQPRVDPASLKARSLPSAVAYPSILPLLAHNERTKMEMLGRNCDSPMPVFNDISNTPTKKVVVVSKSPTSVHANGSSNGKKGGGKVTSVLLECRVCLKQLNTRSGLRRHMKRGHCPICNRPHQKTASKLLDKQEQEQPVVKPTSVCQMCVHKLSLKAAPKNGTTASALASAMTDQLAGSFVKCDICMKGFRRRIQMIKHVMSQHASQMHKVDLAKFVSNELDIDDQQRGGEGAAPWENEC